MVKPQTAMGAFVAAVVVAVARCSGAEDASQPRVLVQGVSPTAIAVCGGFVYWVGTACDGGVPAGGPANLNRIPINGGPNEVAAGNVSDSRSIVCDRGAVYFWQNLDQLAAAPLDGGAASPRAVGVSDPGLLATNDASVFWAGAGGVHMFADGGVTLVSNVDGPSGIAASDDHLYWLASSVDGGGLLAQSLDGGPPSLLWAGQSISRLGLTSSHVYWMQYYPATVMQVELDGGAVSTLLADAGAGAALSSPIVTDGTNIYWTNSTIEVHRGSVDGQADTTVFSASGSFAVADLAVDETSLYVSIQTHPLGLPCGSIVKIAK
jgi:hypothetical protein